MTNTGLRNNIQQIKIEHDDPAERKKLAASDRLRKITDLYCV